MSLSKHLSRLWYLRRPTSRYAVPCYFHRDYPVVASGHPSFSSLTPIMLQQYQQEQPRPHVPPGEKPPHIEVKIPGWQEDLEPRADKKLKFLIRDYGSSAVVVHIIISIISLGTCYVLVSAGVPLEAAFNLLGQMSESAKTYAVGGGAFAIAYILHKCLMPLRLMATALLTPVLVRYLRGKGILKPHKIQIPPQK